MNPFDWIIELVSASPWTYGLVLVAVLLDADLPVLPGETLVITAAIAAAEGDLVVWLVAAAGLVGGLAGDHLSCWIGRRFGRGVYFRFFRGERDRARFEWAKELLTRHSAWVIPAIRFVPGGRTAVTLAAGAVHLSWRSFAVADLVGVTIWAVAYTALGYFWGQVFEDRPWLAFLVSLAIAAVIVAAGYVWGRGDHDDAAPG